MPYESIKQERWAHTPSGEKALGGPAKVHEWDQASKGRSLPMYAKGSKPQDAAYAKGGSVLGKTSEFLKTPDRFTGHKNGPLSEPTEDQFEKGSGRVNPKPRDKSLKPVKPRT